MSKMKQKVLWREIKRLTDINENQKHTLDDVTDQGRDHVAKSVRYATVLLQMMNQLEKLRNECAADWGSEQFRGSIDTQDMMHELDKILDEAKETIRNP